MKKQIAALSTMSLVVMMSCAAMGNPPSPAYIDHAALYTLPNWQAQQNKCIYTDKEVSKFMDRFVELWVEEYKFPGSAEQLRTYFNLVELHWQKTKFSRPTDGEGDSRLLGLTIQSVESKSKISVYVYDESQKHNPKLGRTALAHELIHVALFATTKDIHASHFSRPKAIDWPGKYLELEKKLNKEFM